MAEREPAQRVLPASVCDARPPLRTGFTLFRTNSRPKAGRQGRRKLYAKVLAKFNPCFRNFRRNFAYIQLILCRNFVKFCKISLKLGQIYEIVAGICSKSAEFLRNLVKFWIFSLNLTAFMTFSAKSVQMFLRCELAGRPVDCCALFEPSSIMLRGLCFKLKPLDQHAPNHYGQLSVTLGLLPSWVLSRGRYQVRCSLLVERNEANCVPMGVLCGSRPQSKTTDTL